MIVTRICLSVFVLSALVWFMEALWYVKTKDKKSETICSVSIFIALFAFTAGAVSFTGVLP